MFKSLRRKAAPAPSQPAFSSAGGDAGAHFWKNEHHDPVACSPALSTCICTVDMNGDGSWLLVVADMRGKLQASTTRCAHTHTGARSTPFSLYTLCPASNCQACDLLFTRFTQCQGTPPTLTAPFWLR